MNYTDTLKKVMAHNQFNYRGVIVSKLIGGFELLGKKCLTRDGVDRIIDEAHGVIEKSIVNGNK